MVDDRVTITRDDQGKHIQVAIDASFAVELPEVPTSGYKWEVETSSDLLRLDSSELVDSSAASERSAVFGSAKIRQLQFTAIASGVVMLTLKYWCRWEDDVQERFTIKVNAA